MSKRNLGAEFFFEKKKVRKEKVEVGMKKAIS
jgi:hypothetical protein